MNKTAAARAMTDEQLRKYLAEATRAANVPHLDTEIAADYRAWEAAFRSEVERRAR